MLSLKYICFAAQEGRIRGVLFWRGEKCLKNVCDSKSTDIKSITFASPYSFLFHTHAILRSTTDQPLAMVSDTSSFFSRQPSAFPQQTLNLERRGSIVAQCRIRELKPKALSAWPTYQARVVSGAKTYSSNDYGKASNQKLSFTVLHDTIKSGRTLTNPTSMKSKLASISKHGCFMRTFTDATIVSSIR